MLAVCCQLPLCCIEIDDSVSSVSSTHVPAANGSENLESRIPCIGFMNKYPGSRGQEKERDFSSALLTSNSRPGSSWG